MMDELKSLFEDHKGESDVHWSMQTSAGPRRAAIRQRYRSAVGEPAQEIDQLLGTRLPIARLSPSCVHQTAWFRGPAP